MSPPSPFFRDEFQLRVNTFALPEHWFDLDPGAKRRLTICNLFINHRLPISNIVRVLDEDFGNVVVTLIERGILNDRRHQKGLPPVGFERRVLGPKRG